MSDAFDLPPDLGPTPDYYEVPGARPYQKAMLSDAMEAFAQDEYLRCQLLVSATGTGKTVMMGGFAKTFVRSEQKTLMIAHRDELLTQGIDKFARLGGVAAGLEKAQSQASLSDDVVVGSVQTLKGLRLQGWPRDHFGLIEIDEAHRSLAKGYLDIINHFETARVIGVTATADRGDKQMLGELYTRIVQPEYNMKAGIDDGWLVRVEVQPLSVKIDLNAVGTKKNTDGDTDLDAKAVGHAIEPHLEEIAQQMWEHASKRRILGFTPTVDIARKMVEITKRVGFPRSEWICGDCARTYTHRAHYRGDEKNDRQYKLRCFKQGEIQVLWNAMLLTEGFDQDDIDCLVPLRPTVVRGLYTQMVGRGTRPLDEIRDALGRAADAQERCTIIAASRKPHVLVLDPLWLHEKHDLAAPASLVSKSEDEVRLAKGKQGDLLSIAAEASRDLWDSLREQLLKNANRRVARIDPFTFGVVLGHEALANYHPETLWDARKPDIDQLKALVDNGIEADLVRFRGQAKKILDVIEERKKRGLCSIRLMNWLARHKIQAATMSHEDATRHQRRLFAQGFRQ